jgi:hypothetical protein
MPDRFSFQKIHVVFAALWQRLASDCGRNGWKAEFFVKALDFTLSG